MARAWRADLDPRTSGDIDSVVLGQDQPRDRDQSHRLAHLGRRGSGVCPAPAEGRTEPLLTS
ncbi:hypothetical protein ACTG9Q_31570 [Actinokineospora sp. 24-640]